MAFKSDSSGTFTSPVDPYWKMKQLDRLGTAFQNIMSAVQNRRLGKAYDTLDLVRKGELEWDSAEVATAINKIEDPQLQNQLRDQLKYIREVEIPAARGRDYLQQAQNMVESERQKIMGELEQQAMLMQMFTGGFTPDVSHMEPERNPMDVFSRALEMAENPTDVFAAMPRNMQYLVGQQYFKEKPEERDPYSVGTPSQQSIMNMLMRRGVPKEEAYDKAVKRTQPGYERPKDRRARAKKEEEDAAWEVEERGMKREKHRKDMAGKPDKADKPAYSRLPKQLLKNKVMAELDLDDDAKGKNSMRQRLETFMAQSEQALLEQLNALVAGGLTKDQALRELASELASTKQFGG